MLGPTVFIAPSTTSHVLAKKYPELGPYETLTNIITGVTITMATAGAGYGLISQAKVAPVGAALPATGGVISGAGATAAVGGAGIAGAVLPAAITGATKVGTTALILDYMKNNPLVVIGGLVIVGYFLFGRRKK